jgi:hypothetical protein
MVCNHHPRIWNRYLAFYRPGKTVFDIPHLDSLSGYVLDVISARYACQHRPEIVRILTGPAVFASAKARTWVETRKHCWRS